MKSKRIPKITIIKAANPNFKQVAETIVKLSQPKIDNKRDVS